MAKMCPYRKITSVTSIDGGLLKCTICTKKWPKTGGDCPKNVNPETCEIIIPKRKSKVRRVEAWAHYIGDIPGNGIAVFQFKSTVCKCWPCTILIDEKWLKEKNNAR